MPHAELHLDVPPEYAFAVLSQPRHYGFWVTGARAVHEYDPDWPAVGATFRHSQGRWPLVISDTTTVLASEPPGRLELEARVRPLLVAHVTLTIAPEPGGCRVRMEEAHTGGVLAPVLALPPWPALLARRNLESLRRLRWLAETAGDRLAAGTR
jgi:uncharacterized protein YndB with AHSA1/START domain